MSIRVGECEYQGGVGVSIRVGVLMGEVGSCAGVGIGWMYIKVTSANWLVGTGFTSQYRLQPRVRF